MRCVSRPHADVDPYSPAEIFKKQGKILQWSKLKLAEFPEIKDLWALFASGEGLVEIDARARSPLAFVRS